MAELVDRLKTFVRYCSQLSGDEKGEAQVFCDRLFQAFGHAGYKEAGATLEYRIHRAKGVWFADLFWEKRLLLEMKRRGENLRAHFQQAFDYWVRAVPYRPPYVVLCNFDEFWVYDFDRQIDEPVDVVALKDLPRRYLALNFLVPTNPKPIFGNDREAVTRQAADDVARVFGSLIKRGEDRAKAQRFILQIVVTMFSEDIDLLPRGLMSQLLDDCLNKDESSYDLLGGLFRQMNDQKAAPAGRFRKVPYFNGGLFATIDPIELSRTEAIVLASAANKDWSRVNPAIFGTLFQSSMDQKARHALGAHFTSEADILRIVNPTIVRPWSERIEAAGGMAELLRLRQELHDFRVLDPACGSGNFLYVAYREMVRLEIALLEKIAQNFSAKEFQRRIKGIWLINPSRFFGIERDPFGIELAKVTLMLGKKRDWTR
jgi:type II restriction/modification system DNA methylase subunit YeeA